MEPVDFPETNAVLRPPPEMTEEQCSELPVLRTNNDDGEPVVISCWTLSDEEKAEVARTGKVWLVVWGTTQPPVAPCAVRPFEPAPDGEPPAPPPRNRLDGLYNPPAEGGLPGGG